ncbi:transcription factor HIVEP3 [Cololabis saira]|uniref:transcription factor HIVEP3 n=1 Tax=Cololabis saira TaxID=129043 RepID=UPI002AD3EC87|nr:transcription factor HIVEP3 [Cololabis saira]
MEALHSCLTTGEQPRGQEHCQPESPQPGRQPKSPSQHHQETVSSKSHGSQQQPTQFRRQKPERKRLRRQRQSIDSDTVLEQKQEAPAQTKPGVLSSSGGTLTQSKSETHEDSAKQKCERKPQRPGKYVCTYCGRACAKPSVLQKHIRSHTGERPYPCAPCGFSFKTKSNLYKHRKSHTHRVKAGLALGEPKSLDDQVTESEDETRQLSSASALTDRQSSIASMKGYEADGAKDCTGGSSDSHAVKKRLALRLSRGKHAPQDSADEKTSSLTSGSRGSTESGYFSRSESTEQSQDGAPNTSAKSYAEIILGKYGRLGHLQRMSRHHNQHPSGQEEKNISFTVPKKQVIDHITKLITINEAVVDTSKIDSVKPRRFSLSRKNSSESQKNSSVKETLIHSPKAGDVSYKSTGSISMGVPCEKFNHPSSSVEKPTGQIPTSCLVRSHSMPSEASSFDSSCGRSSKFRLSQSFDDRQPSETQTSRRFGTLRRQPAIEISFGADLTKEDHEVSPSFFPNSITSVPDHKQHLLQPYECETCGTGCKDWEGYKKHKQRVCLAHNPENKVVIGQMECSQLDNHTARAGALTVRKRRKEESFEFDDPSSPSSSTLLSGHSKSERRHAIQTCSVIQHTSSFEKQESLSHENLQKIQNSLPDEEHQLVLKKPHQQQSAKLTARKLIRQNNVQVPEILVTEDFSISSEISTEPTPTTRNLEKLDEFQWPQRSPSLAQLPIEKLPPKKKRLRLAEAAQSSGDSSFDSISLPHSPSQDSTASCASSRSTSFEEPNRPDMEMATSTPLRRSRAHPMLTVPGVHQHREMRRSASEQAPHDSLPSVLMGETRSKSFDYSCLSPERSVVGWRERRKCLLMKHAAITDRNEELEEENVRLRHSPEHVRSSQARPTCHTTSSSSGGGISCDPIDSQHKEIFSQWNLSQNICLMGDTEVSSTHVPSSGVTKKASCIQAPQPSPTHGPSGAARALYLPLSTGLKLEIPSQHGDYSEVQSNQHSVPHITSSFEILRPLSSTAVAVRLQTNTLTPACAIYTTLSQSTSPRPQEAICAISPSIGASAAPYRSHRNMSSDIQKWSGELKLSGSGGSKRMLSPSNSIEFHPESQQQQKRVKEEEEKKVGCTETATVDRSNQEIKLENQSCLPEVGCSVSSVETSFPSLLSGTCNSWCYLNYIKPNPSALGEGKPSVYSSWSTSSYDPNPPGLSSKMAISLLHCKQRLSPSIYTTSPMSVRKTESVEQEDKRSCSPEIYDNPPDCREHDRTEKDLRSADDNRDGEGEEKEELERPEEDVQSCSRNQKSPEDWISENRSNAEYKDVHGGGEGKGPRETCKNASGPPAEPPPRSCGCSSTSTPTVSRVELMRPEAHEKETSSHPEDAHEGVSEDHSVIPNQQKDDQRFGLGNAAAHGDDDGKDKRGRRSDHSRSAVAGRPYTDGEETPLGTLLTESPSTSSPVVPSRRSSASARRALFACRSLDASASASSGGSQSSSSHSLNPPRELSPAPSPSAGPCKPSAPPPSPPSSLPPPTRQASPPPRTGTSFSQIQHLASPGSPGSPADISTRCQARPYPPPAIQSADEVGLALIHPHPPRLRGATNPLSHLPLHSQQPGRSPSLLIPIGGIHMVQPRPPLPVYSLVCSQAAASSRRTDTAAERLAAPQQQQQDGLKEALPTSRVPAGQTAANAALQRQLPCLGPEGGTEGGRTESPGRDRNVYTESSRGRGKAPLPPPPPPPPQAQL